MSHSGMRGSDSYGNQRPTNFGKKHGIKVLGTRVTGKEVAMATKKPAAKKKQSKDKAMGGNKKK